ncbi:hypothetical protein B4U84_03575 [Westiellopsis prolifica IICB1]|nr:hypothetical protein B4U84_03575 [Westiellopsis prolifica IICB1]
MLLVGIAASEMLTSGNRKILCYLVTQYKTQSLVFRDQSRSKECSFIAYILLTTNFYLEVEDMSLHR